ncbi:MAG: CHAT domain-containing protein [Candidatus Krumholzibacteriota bacterium]|nr:CHAT domain-containing protein [Candidatus Krumholzibacteriota bacterium]
MRIPSRAALCLLAVLAAGAAASSPVRAVETRDAALARLDSLSVAWKRDAALPLADSLLAVARAEADSGLVMRLQLQRGMLQNTSGLAREAMTSLRESLALAEARRDTLALCQSLRWLGVAEDYLGRAAAARALYERLITLAEVAGLPGLTAWGWVGIAWRDVSEGNLEASVREYRRALGIFAELGETRGEAWAQNGLGMALNRLGAFDEALACYAESASLARTAGDPFIESQALNNQATLAYSLDDPGAALEGFQAALELQRAIGNPRQCFTPALNVIICQMRLGRDREAEAGLAELEAVCRERGYLDLQGVALNQAATLEHNRGRPRRAADMYRRTLDLGEALQFKTRLEALSGLGLALTVCDSLDAARRTLEEGLALARGGALPIQRIMLRRRLCACLLAEGRPAAAREQIARADAEAERLAITDCRPDLLTLSACCCRALDRPDSARVLLEEAARIWEAERGLSRDPEWREQRGAAGRLLYTDLAAALLDPCRGGDEAARTREAFDRLQAFKARTLLERMMGPGRAAAAPESLAAPLALAELQDGVLDDGELLLDAYLGPRTSLLFAVTRDACRVRRLPAEPALTPRLRDLNTLLRRPGRIRAPGEEAVLAAATAALRDTLLGGLDDLLAGAERVLFSPDASLNLLPLAALDTGKAGAAEIQWTRIPSASVLGLLRHGRADRGAAAGALALAGAAGPNGQPLAGARSEVRSLGRRYADVEVYLPDASAPPIDSSRLAAYGLLHLAAHASVDDQRPWRSAIHLGDGPGAGRLTAVDIAGARLRADLAVLAGCESAGGRVLFGEGVLGLGSAFLVAGVPAVVATLWPVDDHATCRLMERFYEELAADRCAAAALSRARETLRRDPATAHPFHWAGFVLIGDGRLTLDLERRRPPWVPFAVALALLGAAALAMGLARRRR